jgi:hypothetical protein
LNSRVRVPVDVILVIARELASLIGGSDRGTGLEEILRGKEGRTSKLNGKV